MNKDTIDMDILQSLLIKKRIITALPKLPSRLRNTQINTQLKINDTIKNNNHQLEHNKITKQKKKEQPVQDKPIETPINNEPIELFPEEEEKYDEFGLKENEFSTNEEFNFDDPNSFGSNDENDIFNQSDEFNFNEDFNFDNPEELGSNTNEEFNFDEPIENDKELSANNFEIPLKAESLKYAETELSKYKYTPYLNEIIKIIIALQHQYPRHMSDESPMKQVDYNVSKFSKDSTKMYFDVPGIKNKQTFVDTMYKIIQNIVKSNSPLKKLALTAIKELESYNTSRDAGFKAQDLNISQKQLNDEEYDIHHSFFKIETLTDSINSINTILTNSKQRKKVTVLKNDSPLNIQINNGRDILSNYVQGLFKLAEKYLYRCTPPNNIYVISQPEQVKLYELKNQLKFILDDCEAYIHQPDYYEKLYIKLIGTYGKNYNYFIYPTKAQIRNKEQDNGMQKGKRKTKKFHNNSVGKELDDYSNDNNIFKVDPTMSDSYRKLENYIVFNSQNGSDTLAPQGGLFEQKTKFISKYKDYIFNKNDKIVDNVKELAIEIIGGLQDLALSSLITPSLKQFSIDKLVEDLTPWYKEHITLNTDKYYFMLKQICQEAFAKFYTDYLGKKEVSE